MARIGIGSFDHGAYADIFTCCQTGLVTPRFQRLFGGCPPFDYQLIAVDKRGNGRNVPKRLSEMMQSCQLWTNKKLPARGHAHFSAMDSIGALFHSSKLYFPTWLF